MGDPTAAGVDEPDRFVRKAERERLARQLNNLEHGTAARLFTGGRPLAGDDEILPIVAFLADAEARNAAPDRTGQQLAFVILGVAIAGVGLVGLDFAWRHRFRGVRASLVKGKS